MNKTPIALVLGGFAVVITLMFASSIWETNQAGYIQVKQSFGTGELSVISTPGIFCQCFGDLSVYKQAGTYSFADNVDDDSGETAEATLVGGSIPVRFQDGGTATISGQARFDVPADPAQLLRVHNKFRSYDSLAAGLLKPAIREAIVLSAALMTAEESYSGGKAELSQLAFDQLQHGVYLTESQEVEVKDLVTGRTKTERQVRIRKNEDGTPLRKPNTLAQYGITITQLFFPNDFHYEEKILEQIGNVRDAQMKATAAFAQAEAAAQTEKTAEAEGRAKVAEAKAAADVVKQTAITAAEQNSQVAVLNAEGRRQVAEQEKLAAAATKDAQILLGQGEAERKRLVMSADGALQQKLDALVKINDRWAAALEKRSVPGVVFGSDAANAVNNDAQTFMQLQNLKAIKDLGLDMDVKQGRSE